MVRRGWLEDGRGTEAKRGRAQFVRVSWDEVLDRLATEFVARERAARRWTTGWRPNIPFQRRWTTWPVRCAGWQRAVVSAARLIGDDFYGIGLKQTVAGEFVIEINDNPIQCWRRSQSARRRAVPPLAGAPVDQSRGPHCDCRPRGSRGAQPGAPPAAGRNAGDPRQSGCRVHLSHGSPMGGTHPLIAGKRNSKRIKPGVEHEAHTSPPCNAMIALTIASPRPLDSV